MRSRLKRVGAVLLIAILATACATNRNFRRAEKLALAGDWEGAVTYFTRAVQDNPDRPEYKIALERAMINASRIYFDRAQALEEKGDLEGAIAAYRKAIEYDPSNRRAVQRRADLEREVRDRAEASRPKPKIDAMRAEARRQTEAPILNPASKQLLRVSFPQATLQDIFKFLSETTGINILVEQGAQQLTTRPQSINFDGVTLEQALNMIMASNQLWYKVMNDRTILVIQDTAQKRQQYEEQVIRTFYISHADPAELVQLVNQISQIQGVQVRPTVAVNKSANTITIRGTANVVNILEKVILANDRPRAEIVIDVEILEVNRARAKQLGVNLGQYQVDAIFSPEARPGTTEEGETAASNLFNLNTISQGISTADFYLSVPSAIFRFLASDSQSRLVAKPQLRGMEGKELLLNLGDEIPVPTTVFGGLAPGGVNTVPISSYNYRNVGVNVKMTPRVTFENEIMMDIELENSSFTGTVNIAGSDLPQFGTRKVTTRLRLREGESNLLAGLLREEDRRAMTGVPGTLRLPGLKYLFGSSDDQITQTDIVMLLTPRIIRTHELTQEHLNPIYIGSATNLGLTGPAPAIAAPPDQPPAPPGAPVPPGAVPPGEVPPATGPGQTPSATLPVTPGAPTTTPGLAPQPGQPQPAVPAAELGAEAAPTIAVTSPGPELTVGGGPYTMPLSVSNASRMSLVSMTVTFNPATVRVRTVQEGPFMAQGGAQVTFTQQVDPNVGRVDISLTRGADATGASGTGLLAAMIVEPVAAGAATFSVSGVATTPEGRTIPLRFTPAAVTVK